MHHQRNLSSCAAPHGLVQLQMRPASGAPWQSALCPEARRRLLLGELEIPDGGIASNLVVDTGRGYLARLLGGAKTNTLAYLALGNCAKTGNLPALSDVDLADELVNPTTSVAAATFAIDDETEILYPSSAAIFPTNPALTWGSTSGTVEIDGRGRTVFEDLTVDMAAEGIAFGHRITLDVPGQELVYTVKRVLGTNTLELHNPDGYETPGVDTISWRVDSPGTQLLVSKVISGDSFPAAEWGSSTVVTEAALRFDDTTLFSRVLLARDREGVGLVMQPSTSIGGRIDLVVNWLITF